MNMQMVIKKYNDYNNVNTKDILFSEQKGAGEVSQQGKTASPKPDI